MSAAARRDPADAGFTLLEVLVTIVIAGIIMAFAVSGWASYARAAPRTAPPRRCSRCCARPSSAPSPRAPRSACCSTPSPTTYTVYRRPCDDSSKIKLNGPYDVDGRVHLDAADFTSASGDPPPG